MANCDLTFSTFSASQSAAALGIRKGWHARVADQLINGKRYVGKLASAAATEPTLNTTKGHHSIIVDDCGDNCKSYGSTYSRTSDGKLKGRAGPSVIPSCTPDTLQQVFCSQTALRVQVTPGQPIPPNNCSCPPSNISTNFTLFEQPYPGPFPDVLCYFEDSVDPFIGNLQFLTGSPCRVRFGFTTCVPLCGGVHHGIGVTGQLLPEFDPTDPFPMTVNCFPFCFCNNQQTTIFVSGWTFVIREWP